jgi:TetR/AcrR family transcriptional regulator
MAGRSAATLPRRDSGAAIAVAPPPATPRSRILAATVRLIRDQGDRFTIQDVLKEAGVALQTFYRSFAGKDELLLAVFAEMIADACKRFRVGAEGISDPVERLRLHLAAVVDQLHRAEDGGEGARFVTSQRARLSMLFPEATALATRPFTDLVETEIRAATDAGRLRSVDPGRDAWLITHLVLSVFRHDAFGSARDATLAADVWRFCLFGLAGDAPTASGA